MSKLSFLVVFLLLSLANCQQLQWYLVSDGSGFDSPPARRDAALGFDMSFLILYGGRDGAGMPLQDSYAFNTIIGQWERLDFANAPPARYGMASANAIGSGLYIFGGFGSQGSSSFYNPYIGYGSSGLPFYKQSPAASKKQKRNAPTGKQNMNQMNPTGYNNYNNDDEYADDNFNALGDGWYLNYAMKTWQNFQSFQYPRGFGSASASPFSIGGVPRIIYSMGKSREGMYSIVESIDQPLTGLRQQGFGQPATIMHDLSSYSPAYPHARHGHSTALLTDNHLLLYGGCLSGYSKGGPCPSTDTWLLHIDSGHWERLWECPTTKTGASMVTLPSSEMCAALGQGIYPQSGGFNAGSEPPAAVLWGGREKNDASIRTYPSPDDEVAVFSLSRKEWFLKRASPSPTGGRYPMQREGAAHVAGCFQGMPGMYVFGGRSVMDGRVLSDLWFLQASPSAALNAPTGRSCIYPFSFYHLHGMFQFFAYGVFFPIGYIIGIFKLNTSSKRLLHIVLQMLGVALAICGFAFGVHAHRGPDRFHFRSPHGVLGIITFILTVIQLLLGLANIALSSANKSETKTTATMLATHTSKTVTKKTRHASPIGHFHHFLGALILALGFVNISLGVFFAVLPLAVWIIWFIYLGFLFFIIVGLEVVTCLRSGSKGGSKKPQKHSGSGGGDLHITEIGKPSFHSKPGPPPLERLTDEDDTDRRPYRRDIEQPLIPNSRHPRPGDVSGSGTLPQYHRPSERDYPVPPARARPNDSTGFDYYEGRPSGQPQNQRNLTRVRLE